MASSTYVKGSHGFSRRRNTLLGGLAGELFCWHIAHHIYNLQAVLDADRFVVSGGITNEQMFFDLLQEAVDRKFEEAYWHLLHQPEILRCKFEREANLVGALYNYRELIEE